MKSPSAIVSSVVCLFAIIIMHNVINFTLHSIDDTPTWQQLTVLDVPERGVFVRIMDKIGKNYDTLGPYLLDDDDGSIMDTITHDYRFAREILGEIFRRWMRRQPLRSGDKTNTWEMLVKYLKYSELMALADEIESVLQFCAVHVDDEECVHGYGERKHEAPMVETTSFLQLLISMLAAVSVVAAIFRCKSKLNLMVQHIISETRAPHEAL